MKKYLVLLAAILAITAISASVAGAEQPVDENGCSGGEVFFGGECQEPSTPITICHVAGLASDPANYLTLNITLAAAVGQAGHFGENGTPNAGHEQDTLGACNPPPPPDVEISAQAAATQPTCENDGLTALSFGNENGVGYDVQGNVAPGETVTVTAHPLLGFLLVGASEFEFTFDSFDAAECEPDEPGNPDEPDNPNEPDGPDKSDNPDNPAGGDSSTVTEREGEVPHTL